MSDMCITVIYYGMSPTTVAFMQMLQVWLNVRLIHGKFITIKLLFAAAPQRSWDRLVGSE